MNERTSRAPASAVDEAELERLLRAAEFHADGSTTTHTIPALVAGLAAQARALRADRDNLRAAADELLTAAFLLREDPTDEMWAERFRSCAAHMAGLLPNPDGEVAR